MQENYTATINVSYYTKVSCQKLLVFTMIEKLLGYPTHFSRKWQVSLYGSVLNFQYFKLKGKKHIFLFGYFLNLKHSPVEHEALQKSEFRTSEGHESSRRKNSLVDRSPSHFKLNTTDLYTQT